MHGDDVECDIKEGKTLKMDELVIPVVAESDVVNE